AAAVFVFISINFNSTQPHALFCTDYLFDYLWPIIWWFALPSVARHSVAKGLFASFNNRFFWPWNGPVRSAFGGDVVGPKTGWLANGKFIFYLFIFLQFINNIFMVV